MAAVLESDIPAADQTEASDETTSSGIASPELLLAYLSEVLNSNFDADPQDLAYSFKNGVDEALLTRLSRFAADTNDLVIYISKISGRDTGKNQIVYSILTEFGISSDTLAIIAVIKTQGVLEPSLLRMKLNFFNLPLETSSLPSPSNARTFNPYGFLHSIIHLVVNPYFDALARTQDTTLSTTSKLSDDPMALVPSTRKKITELELSLSQLQNDVDIPHLSLTLHPTIQRALMEAMQKDISPTVELISPELLADSTFINQVQTIVNSWIKSIQTITKMSRQLYCKEAIEEIRFWLSMESRLNEIETQLEGNGVALTLQVLRQAKRFHATVSFWSDTGLSEALDRVHQYNQLLSDFPIDELLSAGSFSAVRSALVQIFNHTNKKLRVCSFPLERAVALIDALSGDLDSKMRHILNGKALIRIDYATFQNVIAEAESVFQYWNDLSKDFVTACRELSRKRQSKFFLIRLSPRHIKLQERVEYLKGFRHSHQQLEETIRDVLENDSSLIIPGYAREDSENAVNIMHEISRSYAALHEVDVLDTSPEGSRKWDAAEADYKRSTTRAESSLISYIRDKLAAARTADEMFQVFSKFSKLFVRPRIRAAIQEYQNQLTLKVKADIKSLQDRYRLQYGNSDSYEMAKLRDIPPISGSIIWLRQIQRQLNAYMQRLQDVLGEGWSYYPEGQALQAECTAFQQRLDVSAIFESWLKDFTARQLSIRGCIFQITHNREDAKQLCLSVAFNAPTVTLFKEVRVLQNLKFQIPHAILAVAKDTKRVYPFAVRLKDAMEAYNAAQDTIKGLGLISILLNQDRAVIRNLFSKGMAFKWEYFVHGYEIKTLPYVNGKSEKLEHSREPTHVRFVSDISSCTKKLQLRSIRIRSIETSVKSFIKNLNSCEFNSTTMQGILSSIQSVIDSLYLDNFCNLPNWVYHLNKTIENIFVSRLANSVLQWINIISSKHSPSSANFEEFAPSSLNHQVIMQDQFLTVDPPLERSKAIIYSRLSRLLAVITDLKRLNLPNYGIILSTQSTVKKDPDFASVANKVSETLEKAYDVADNEIKRASDYCRKWTDFQCLWDLEADLVFSQLGDALDKWIDVLHDLRRESLMFDNSKSSERFGNIVIHYDNVQTIVTAKYNSLQREILYKFSEKVAYLMRQEGDSIRGLREEFEQQALDVSSINKIVMYFRYLQKCESGISKWTPSIDLFRQSQTLLARRRFQFPSDWLYTEQIDNELKALMELHQKKQKLLDRQEDDLRTKTTNDYQILSQRVENLRQEWFDQRNILGSSDVLGATESLAKLATRVFTVKAERDLITEAHTFLGLKLEDSELLDSLYDEIVDFQSVWSSLSGIWRGIEDLKEVLWLNVSVRKLKASLEALMETTRGMPSRMRQYSAFESTQESLRSLIASCIILPLLKSDAVRERHWDALSKKSKTNRRIYTSTLTLGQVWDLRLDENESFIKDLVRQAQGEMNLEMYLRQVKETWSDYNLELVNYKGRTYVIRGWDDLLSKIEDNLNGLSSMKHSPFYKVFAEEATIWENKLDKLLVIFNTWVDVQRQWIYMDGIFTGNTDLQQMLQIESNRFNTASSELFAIIKKVSRSPFALDIHSIPDIQPTLERLLDLLSKLQKSLSEYLENERSRFPRFYFVGDEDLLEILGNAKNIPRLQKHFQKMFPGVSSVNYDEDSSKISSVISPEGEELSLMEPISLKDRTRVNEWLKDLEVTIKSSLYAQVNLSVRDFEDVCSKPTEKKIFSSWIEKYTVQATVLSSQIFWTCNVEDRLKSSSKDLSNLIDLYDIFLHMIAEMVIADMSFLARKKCEQLITEFTHQRRSVVKLIEKEAESLSSFAWLSQLRFYHSTDPQNGIVVKICDHSFDYGFEYLGAVERLVRTPLTDRCYVSLTHALANRLGGSPYGPAGTGKTETVKSLGGQLGRNVLVFNCDDTFDFSSMGRILSGVCQTGAWGCFDEFNRLDEEILSAVSSLIQSIQQGLRNQTSSSKYVTLIGKQVELRKDCGIFITMNPGYSGRSQLPDNLKKLFLEIAMNKPDREMIVEVLLYGQGFTKAQFLASKLVPLFDSLDQSLSRQAHYDFSLRALKSVLNSCGRIKRQSKEISSVSLYDWECGIVVSSLDRSFLPKLYQEDVYILTKLRKEAFPNACEIQADTYELKNSLENVAEELKLVASPNWIEKVLQIRDVQELHHGVILAGESDTGKTMAWKSFLKATDAIDGLESIFYLIDAKVVNKEQLYGKLDSTTREWNDGLFTAILRKILNSLRGEALKRHWIVFDGDIDPEWVENLNSVLDDNKLLTLPTGERIRVPKNVRIVFEVENLLCATPATISRCGLVWFEHNVASLDMISQHSMKSLFSQLSARSHKEEDDDGMIINEDRVCTIVSFLQEKFGQGEIIAECLKESLKYDHIMAQPMGRSIKSFFALLSAAIGRVLSFSSAEEINSEDLQRYLLYSAAQAFVWSMTGDSSNENQLQFSNYLLGLEMFSTLEVFDRSVDLLGYSVSLPKGNLKSLASQLSTVELEGQLITRTDVVIPTTDTLKLEKLLYDLLAEHQPLILCGPPGSGKTMTLFNALRKLPDMDVAGLNFSSTSTPSLVLKTLEQYCQYTQNMRGTTLSPPQRGRWLVIFCDEINLPAPDKYHTQRVIFFLRQLIEQNGFWKTSDKSWVSLERVQFVGACNPPTDPGRHPLSSRFIRHTTVVCVNYPTEPSLTRIYSALNTAALKSVPNLRGYESVLTESMVAFYLKSKSHFSSLTAAHYVYSPRELTRWNRGIYESIRPLEYLTLEELVRIWAHEGLRLFEDRLITEEEKTWTYETLKEIASTNFPGLNIDTAFRQPILFSNWLSLNYVSVGREELREFTKARMRTFCEEEVDISLVLFDEVLDHILRIDRVLRQPQGHMILIGVSGSGKTTMARFVAWMNGFKVYQLGMHANYSAADFDSDLRDVLRAASYMDEKICFILDESNILQSAFLERMNTLLANAEIPGLYEGDEWTTLMTACKDASRRKGLLLDTPAELYDWFTSQIIKNLHVVLTMNPPSEGFATRASTSPALFNRCVLDWMGNWSLDSFYQVAFESTSSLDIEYASYSPPAGLPILCSSIGFPPKHREVFVDNLVYIHHTVQKVSEKLQASQRGFITITPRHFLEFIQQLLRIFDEKRNFLESNQIHLNAGIDRLRETVLNVRSLRSLLTEKKVELEKKDKSANEKLQQMVNDQKIAEQKRTASIEIQAALDQQEQRINERQTKVLQDLEKAEPAVLEARNSVKNIKKQHLTEVRSMANPPEAVKLTLEAVCTLLGYKADSWRNVQSIIRRDDFIASIVTFDNARDMTQHLAKMMRKNYLSHPIFNFEAVNRASKACGPLMQWVEAQVMYSGILEQVGPLREEVMSLQDQANQTKARATAINEMISELEESIATYKEEYAALVSETQSIRSEMQIVERKVERSLKLLDSLAIERQRWKESTSEFDRQMAILPVQATLAAAFLTYAGYFDGQYRNIMLSDWIVRFEETGLKFDRHQTFIEYLSTPDQRMNWQQSSLPQDDISSQNAIMLDRCIRYPLVIDPSDKIVQFLKDEHQKAGRSLRVTSFLDDSFVKHLESALRFGNSILIQDAEHLDPILNPILNMEYQKTGGRILVRLGRQEIDFSPTFRLILTTRNRFFRFSPDICSRTTLINFTVTRASLEAQVINMVLKHEQPEMEQKRKEILASQTRFLIDLRSLESRLLQSISEAKGSILDNDIVTSNLEKLKMEASDIKEKSGHLEEVLSKMEEIAEVYKPIAQVSSIVYRLLNNLNRLHPFYEFSLEYFWILFTAALSERTLKGIKAADQGEIDKFIKQFLLIIYRRTSQALTYEHRVCLAMLLLKMMPGAIESKLFGVIFNNDWDGYDVSSCSQRLSDVLEKLPENVRSILADIPEINLENVRHSTLAENIVAGWKSDGISSSVSLLAIKALRVDRLLPALEIFIDDVFGTGCLSTSYLSMAEAVQDKVGNTLILALCSEPGYDASFKVDELAKQQATRYSSIAMGSNDVGAVAEKAISEAAQHGGWVLLKNIHLATRSWLDHLEKRLHVLSPHEGFRLFFTTELNKEIPANLLRESQIILYSAPHGIKASLSRSLQTWEIRKESVNETRQVLFILSWFHAILQEGQRYSPAGWSKPYEFNESDFEHSIEVVESWINKTARGRANVSPENIPWDAIRYVIGDIVYGGKVDVQVDMGKLERLASHLFSSECFETKFSLVPGSEDKDYERLNLPHSSNKEDVAQWIQKLPEREPLQWLDLPEEAEKLRLTNRGNQILQDVSQLAQVLDDEVD